MFVRAAKKVKENGLENEIMNADGQVYYSVFDEWVNGASQRKFYNLIKQFKIFLRDLQKE